MNLTKALKTEELKGEKSDDSALMIYSPKLGKEIPLNFDEPIGNVQRYNVGLAPGTWY